jgi:hypothetical protein
MSYNEGAALHSLLYNGVDDGARLSATCSGRFKNETRVPDLLYSCKRRCCQPKEIQVSGRMHKQRLLRFHAGKAFSHFKAPFYLPSGGGVASHQFSTM